MPRTRQSKRQKRALEYKESVPEITDFGTEQTLNRTFPPNLTTLPDQYPRTVQERRIGTLPPRLLPINGVVFTYS